MNKNGIKKVIVKIEEDHLNNKFGKVFFDFGNGKAPVSTFDVRDSYEKACIAYFTRKGICGNNSQYVFVDLNTEKVIKEEINPRSLIFGIASSLPNEDALSSFIILCDLAASNLDILVPFYLENGKEKIFYNQSTLEKELYGVPFDREHQDYVRFAKIKMITNTPNNNINKIL